VWQSFVPLEKRILSFWFPPPFSVHAEFDSLFPFPDVPGFGPETTNSRPPPDPHLQRPRPPPLFPFYFFFSFPSECLCGHLCFIFLFSRIRSRRAPFSFPLVGLAFVPTRSRNACDCFLLFSFPESAFKTIRNYSKVLSLGPPFLFGSSSFKVGIF